MLYMAGDNGKLPVFDGMETPGYTDLSEIKKVGSTDAVHLLAQFDTLRDRKTWRYHLSKGKDLKNDLVETVGETNTGDPQYLTDFIVWGAQKYPADHYAVILWNHGNGWSDEDVYASFRAAQKRGGVTVDRQETRSLSRSRLRTATFRTTLEDLPTQVTRTHSRGILYDDSSLDFLTNVEMKKALSDAVAKAHRPKIDLLGMDACLMSMVEVAYQVRDSCAFLVGSQEVEPMAGWPYDTILAALAARPEISPKDLSKLIVSKYVTSYAGVAFGDNATQSALDENQVPTLVSAIDDLAVILMAKLQDQATLIGLGNALMETQTFEKPDYIDLRDFCSKLVKAVRDPQVAAAAKRIALLTTPGKGPLVASARTGGKVKKAKGISIYFPKKGLAPEDGMATLYKDLDFAQDCHWPQFLADLYAAQQNYRSRLMRGKGRSL